MGERIAVDAQGCAYVTGWTGDEDFPRVHPFQNTLYGLNDALVLKIGKSVALTPVLLLLLLN